MLHLASFVLSSSTRFALVLLRFLCLPSHVRQKTRSDGPPHAENLLYIYMDLMFKNQIFFTMVIYHVYLE